MTRLTIVFFCFFSDIFLPCPDNLLVNLSECRSLVEDLLNQLPRMFDNNMETRSAMGAALQAAYKMMVSDRITSLRKNSLRKTSLRKTSLRITSLRITSLRITSLRKISLRITSLRITSLRITSLRKTSLRKTSLRKPALE